MIPWLRPGDPFPPVTKALERPNGLLAAGGNLSVDSLLRAYRQGIFPWFSEGEPLMWWSPDPRMVLFPEEFNLSRSLGKTLRNRHYTVRADTHFRAVVEGCAAPRPGSHGTWITARMIDAYCELHDAGWAHSVETWMDGELAGGLYGVAIGHVFFGESMFARVKDASKIAFAHLVAYVRERGFGMIDCQMATEHLASLGAREIPRREFSAWLATLVNSSDSRPAPWPLLAPHEGAR